MSRTPTPQSSKRPGRPSIYFDYNATTPLDPHVREAMLPFLGDVYGNPSSVHQIGRRARALQDEARERVAAVWKCKPSEVVFTSGGTESANLAILGTARFLRPKGRHLIASRIEHHAVLHACEYLVNNEGFELTLLPVDTAGFVSPDALRDALRPDTVLVSLMAANNEIGTLQPVAEAGRICRERGIAFHTDAVQWMGKQPFASIHDFNADLVTVCAHKLHGPKGAGALFVASGFKPVPLQFGGQQENEKRAGTENLACIVALAEASERFVRIPVFDPTHLSPLLQRLETALAGLGTNLVTLRTPPANRLPNTIAFTVTGADSTAVLAGLDLEGVCASGGAACSAGSLEPSHVILALGGTPEEASSLIRFSLGRESTLDEVEHVIRVLPEVIERAQRFQ